MIETHSEHLLLRLRRRIAEGRVDVGDVALYFVDNQGGATTCQLVPIAEDGSIQRDEWPKGFFEEQLTDAFALAIAQSRGRG